MKGCKHIALLFCLILIGGAVLRAQCPNDNTLNSTVNPTGVGFTTTVACVPAGQYVAVNVVAGGSYNFNTCSGTGDSQVTVLNAANAAVVGYNDDGCGVRSTVNFTSAFTGVVWVLVDEFPCTNSGACFPLTISFTTLSALPANDGCANAIPVNCGTTINGTTSGATGEVIGGCGGNNNSPSLWYSFAGNGNNVTFSLCGSLYDTFISVFSGSCGALNCVQSNDDFCGAQSQVTINTLVGTTYYIRVHGYQTGSGTFTFTTTCLAPVANDPCSGALPIVCGQTVTGNTAAASADPLNPACGGSVANTSGVWYALAGNNNNWTISLCGSAYDTFLSIYSGSCSALNCVISNDDFCGGQSQVSFTANLGTTYYVYVHGFLGASGAFTLNATCCTAAPPNDLCSSAIPVTCGQTLSGTTACALADVVPFGCTFFNASPRVWYSFIGNGDYITVQSCGSALDTEIGIYTGTCAALTCFEFNDDGAACAPSSELGFFSVAGGQYYISVASPDGSAGNFNLSISCGPPPPPTPQDCNGAVTICNDQQFGGNSAGSGNQDDLNDANNGCLGTENQTSWYVFSPTTVGTMAFLINPTPPVDYDFAVWGPYNSPLCPPVGEPIRCSFAASVGPTGLQNGAGDLSEGIPGNRLVEDIDVTVAELNRYYILLVDNFTASTTPFVLDWTLSGVILNCALQLPIELVDFAALPLRHENAIYWRTATELNNALFVVERSDDGIHFDQVHEQPGAGTVHSEREYEWLDEDVRPGVVYYRLKQIDDNGTYTYSSVIRCERKEQVYLRPNPASESVHVDLSPFLSKGGKLVLTDISGRKCAAIDMPVWYESTGFKLDVTFLNPGIYAVHFINFFGEEIQTERLIISR